MLRELADYPAPRHDGESLPHGTGGIAVRLQQRSGADVLSFISTTTVFGTPVDSTLSELAIEAFFPADEATARAVHATVTVRPRKDQSAAVRRMTAARPRQSPLA